MGVLEFVLSSFWFILPAYFANMAPLMVPDVLKLRNVRLDGGKNWFDGRPILGSHKSLHGLIVGVGLGAVVGWVLERACESWAWNFCLGVPSGWKVGALLGLGAIVGDAVKSFFKRRFNVKAGGKWFPWDQIDFILGAFLFASAIVRVELTILAFLVIVTPILHKAVNWIGWKLGLKEVPW
jgi:CDP-2,3-bis-(O-geranylgeranyl)-sn-glycerol synthase